VSTPSAASFGFSAVVGHDDLKLALLLAAIDPGIGGVLLRGDKGSGKTTLARGLAALLPGDAPFVELPLGATEDRVLGSIDLAAALASGAERVRRGLLADADGGVLYVDEVNLLADHLVDTLLDVAVSGEHRLERDGVSVVQAARFVLVGTMNPEEGELRPQLLDRFGLCVTVHAPDDPAVRAEIVRRRLAFDHPARAAPVPDTAGPPGGAGAGRGGAGGGGGGDRALQNRLARTRAAAVGDDVIAFAAHLALAVGAEGVRADIVLCRAAAALAGWDGRPAATVADVERVAPLVLAHRRHRSPFDPPVLDPGELASALDEARRRHAAGAGAPDPGPGSDDPVTRSVANQPDPSPEHGSHGRGGPGAAREPHRAGPGAAGNGHTDPCAPADGGHHATRPQRGDTTAGRGAGGGRGTEAVGRRADNGTGAPADPDDTEEGSGGAAGGAGGGHAAGTGAGDAASGSGAGFGDASGAAARGAGARGSGAGDGRAIEIGAARAGTPLPTGPRSPAAVGGPSGGRTARGRAGPGTAPGAGSRGREVRDVPFDPAGSRRPAVTASVRTFAQRRTADPTATPEVGDLRASVRDQRAGTLVVIALDTSGSMGARDRVRAATGAVLGLLTDAYQRRDRVAVVTFAGSGAAVALAPTSSVEVARTRLAAVRTGGTTPLADGLRTALDVARRATTAGSPGASGPGTGGRAVIVVVTDGRATAGPDAPADALAAATAVRAAGVPALVLDAETGTPRLGLAARLAAALGADCRPVADLTAGTLHDLTATRR